MYVAEVMKENTNQRYEEIDVCKGLGMILVIIGHMLLLGTGMLRSWVWSFYMPMFVIVSGFFYKQQACEKYIYSLLLPYYKIGILCIILYAGLFRGSDLVQEFVALICGCTAPYYIVFSAASLWFLTMFFVVKVIYTIVDSRIHNIYIQTIIYLLFSVVGVIIGRYRGRYSFVYNIDIALVFILFYHVGRGIGIKKVNEIRNYSNLINLIIVAISLGTSLLLTRLNGGYDVFQVAIGGNYLLFYLNAIAGTMFMIEIAYFVSKIKCIKELLGAIGKNTLLILAIHYPLVQIYLMYIKEQLSLPRWFSWIVCIIIIFVSYVLAEFIKTYFPSLLGKSNNRNERDFS